MITPRNSCPSTRGFTLIELTIAIFVFAIGVLSVFLLLGNALDEGQSSVRYSRISLFGEDVLEALEERSEYFCENPGTNGDAWVSFWSDLASGYTSVVVAAGSSNGVWEAAAEVTGGGPYTNIFVRYPMHQSGVTGVVSHALRYTLRADFMEVRTNLVKVQLNVWEGQYGQYDDDGVVFFTLFTDRGSVP